MQLSQSFKLRKNQKSLSLKNSDLLRIRWFVVLYIARCTGDPDAICFRVSKQIRKAVLYIEENILCFSLSDIAEIYDFNSYN